MDEVDFYTIDEMAEKLRVSKQSVYKQINQGSAGKSIPPFIKLGGRIRFKVTDYEEWYKNL
jgi:excisionase family DNA binding protein